jgi:hypothetical protein
MKSEMAAGAAAPNDNTANRERVPDAVQVTGISRHVPPLPPKPEERRVPVIVASAQLKGSSPGDLWLVSDPATVKLTGEWTATIRLSSKQSRTAPFTVVALVVPYGTLAARATSAAAGAGGPGDACNANEPCPSTEPPCTNTPSTQVPALKVPAPKDLDNAPSPVELCGPRMRGTLARSAEKTVSLKGS